MDYIEFLQSKADHGALHGFEPIEVPGFLRGFQVHLTDWAIRKGRSAIFAGCGLGKTPMQLVYADNVARKTGKPVLILTPLAVAWQTVQEAKKFGIDGVAQSRDGTIGPSPHIVVTNYQQLHRFRPEDFSGCVCDESSVLKNYDGKTKDAVTEFMRVLPYRLLCTATPSPNDYIELGTSSEALGEMGYQDMLTMFFRDERINERPYYVHAFARQAKKVLKSHAERDFWRWICSWARACRKPSDLGFDDDDYDLPPLTHREHIIEASRPRDGYLFDLPAKTLQDQREERRRTIEERCEKVAELVAHDRPAIAWCHLNDEGNLLEKMVPGAVQISGSDDDDAKESAILGFIAGDIRVLISKPSIFGYGLNLQHCSHMTFFPSHSWEQYHQGVSRCHRFGQDSPVHVDIVSSEGEAGVVSNLRRKADQAEAMFARLVELMHDHLVIEKTNPFTTKEEKPPWLSSHRKSPNVTPCTTAMR